MAELLPEFTRVPGFRLHGPEIPAERVAVVAFNLEGWESAHLGYTLDEEYGIAVRVGLHCAPETQKALGTFPSGAVRASFGP